MTDFQQEVLGMGIVYGVVLGVYFFPVAALIVGALVLLTFGYNYLIEKIETPQKRSTMKTHLSEYPLCEKTAHYAACV
jgi:hypothetical protein